MADLSSNINYLQPTGFKVIMDRKHFPNATYFANSVSHPNVSAPETIVPYSRMNLRAQSDKLTFGEIQLNIIMDEDMKAYEEMYDWIKSMVEVNTVDAVDRSVTQRPTYSDISVIPLSSNNNSVKTIKYIDCLPTSLGTVEFVTTNADEFITFPISFSFNYFELA